MALSQQESADTGIENLSSNDLDQPIPGKQSRIISRVLSPAVRLWLRSQLDHVENLDIAIEAGDRQLLSGTIQQVTASASKAVYRGLHLSQISVVSQQIQTNLGQVVRGKPFRLLASFPVAANVALSSADLNASMTAPLLATAITDFLLSLLQAEASTELSQLSSLKNIQVTLGEGSLTFHGVLAQGGVNYPIQIETALRVEAGNQLILDQFECFMAESLPQHFPDRFAFDLGADVYLESLVIQPEQITCQGRITVVP